jgi:hypothetical protein
MSKPQIVGNQARAKPARIAAQPSPDPPKVKVSGTKTGAISGD